MHLQVPFSYALLCIIVIIAILKCSPFAYDVRRRPIYRMHQKLKIITANNDSTLARCPSHHRQSIYCCCNIRSRVLANKVRHDLCIVNGFGRLLPNRLLVSFFARYSREEWRTDGHRKPLNKSWVVIR